MFSAWHRKVEKKKMSTFNTITLISTLNALLWLGEDLQSTFTFVFLSKHCGFACKEILFCFWRECTGLFSFKQFCWAAAQVWLTLRSCSVAVNHCEMLLEARQPRRVQVLHGGGERSYLWSARSRNLNMASAGRPQPWESGSSIPSFQGTAGAAGSQMFNVHLWKILPAAALRNLGFHWRS